MWDSGGKQELGVECYHESKDRILQYVVVQMLLFCTGQCALIFANICCLSIHIIY